MSTRKARPPRQQWAYLLYVELEEITPTIWRRIWVDDSMPLIQLHHTLQAAMGWTDAHLHEFRIKDETYATPDPEDEFYERVVKDERDASLHTALGKSDEFTYVYDFGDHWVHRIRLERSRSRDEPAGYGFIESGERACPPEDCGGFIGYQEFLDKRRDKPKAHEVKDFLRWAGEDFDPNRFDRHAANAALLRMAWNRWGLG